MTVYCLTGDSHMAASDTEAFTTYHPSTTTNCWHYGSNWHVCNQWCGCRPTQTYWCDTCCRYTLSQHYHYCPPVRFVPLPAPCSKPHVRDARHRPYVDIRPALPRHGC